MTRALRHCITLDELQQTPEHNLPRRNVFALIFVFQQLRDAPVRMQ